MTRIRFNDKIVVWPGALRELVWERGPVELRAKIAVMKLGKISLREKKATLVRRLDDGSWNGGRSLELWNRAWEEEPRGEMEALAKLEAKLESGETLELGWIPAGRWCIGQNKIDLKKAILEGDWE